MDITLATGVTIDYDETDLKEHKKLSNYAFYSPSIEYYLKNEKDNLNKVIIVGAGVGIYSKYLDSESIETINIEPVLSRFNKLEGWIVAIVGITVTTLLATVGGLIMRIMG